MAFKKGQSGNPSGRPKENAEVKALARKYTKEAVEALVAAMRDGDHKVSVAAAIALLDRAHGKPAMTVTGEDGGPIEQVILHLGFPPQRQE